jgi:hypothetical protein
MRARTYMLARDHDIEITYLCRYTYGPCLNIIVIPMSLSLSFPLNLFNLAHDKSDHVFGMGFTPLRITKGGTTHTLLVRR